jgi:predicted membrane metal-binding protein
MTMLNTLLDPPFAKNPAFRADAKIVGIVCAVLAGLGVLFGLLALPITLALLGAAPVLALSLIVSLVGNALVAYGGWQMYQGKAEGKRWVIYGLVVSFVTALIAMLMGSGSQLLGLVIIAIVYYVVVTSRYPSATGTGTTSQVP